MLTITCDEMKAMDSYAINNIGIPSIVLMENAALRVEIGRASCRERV